VSTIRGVVFPQQEEPEPQKQKLDLSVIRQKLSLTLEECAVLTGFKICALRSAIWAGDLPYIRIGAGGRYLIRRESLEKFLAGQERREAQ
jgi:excisionase family DNA binding protein